MLGIVLGFLFNSVPTFFRSSIGKYAIIAACLFAAYLYAQHQIYLIDKAGYERGVMETERKYEEAERKDKATTSVQEKVIKQYVNKKTDADIADILDFWMQHDPESLSGK